jgi:hypothetical protein
MTFISNIAEGAVSATNQQKGLIEPPQEWIRQSRGFAAAFGLWSVPAGHVIGASCHHMRYFCGATSLAEFDRGGIPTLPTDGCCGIVELVRRCAYAGTVAVPAST